MSFPDRLAALRKEHGFTQQQMADKIDMQVSQLKRYESGAARPTIEVFRRIALAPNGQAAAVTALKPKAQARTGAQR